MKKKIKQYGKCTLSLVLSLMIIMSCMIIGQITEIEASADTTYYLAGSTSITKYDDSSAHTSWTNLEYSSFSLTQSSSTDYYIDVYVPANADFKITNGTNWYSVGSNFNANSKSNNIEADQTDNTTISNGEGYYRVHLDPTGYSNKGAIWIDVLSAPDISETKNWYVMGTLAGSSVNAVMTSNGDDTYTYSTGLSYTDLANSHFNFKRVQAQGTETVYGSGSDGDDWYLKTETTSSNGPDHWLTLVKGNTKNYYFDGSSDQLVNLIIDESDISSLKFKFTLVDPNYTNININRRLGASGTAAADASNVQCTTNGYTGATIDSVPSGTTLAISATESITDGGTTYYFSRWEVTSGSGNIGDSSLATTTFTPNASNSTVTALYFEKVNATVAWDNDGTNVTSAALSPNTNVKAGDSLTLTFTKNGNTSIRTFTFGGQTFTVPWVDGNDTQGTYTFTAPDALTSSNATLTYTTGELSTYYIDALLLGKYSTYGTMYIKGEDDSDYINVNSVSSVSKYQNGFYVSEGQTVSVKLVDNNLNNGTNHGDCEYIIEGFTFSENYYTSANSTPRKDAVTASRSEALASGGYEFTFYPTSSMEIIGTFAEDKGVNDSTNITAYGDGTEGRWLLMGSNDAFANKQLLPIMKTVTGRKYVFFDDDLFERIQNESRWWIALTANQNATGKTDIYNDLRNSNGVSKKAVFKLSSDYANETTKWTELQSWSDDYAEVQEKDMNDYYFGNFVIKNDYVISLKIELREPDGSVPNTYGPNGKQVMYVITPTVSDDAIAPGSGVNVIAKDGTIRDDYKKYADLADTEIYAIGSTTKSNGKIGSVSVNSKAYDSLAEKAEIAQGSEVTIKTTIADGYRDQYYVRAFNINGETYAVNSTVNSNGEYTCTFTIPSDAAAGSKYEITPIYYYNESYSTNSTNNKKFITFYVENFDDKVKNEWGKNTSGTYTSAILACYAWYGTGNDKNSASSSSKPALGGYPGQPMVYVNGRYEMQVPQYANNGTDVIQGITLNNYVWDYVHSNVLGASSDDDREPVNCQTYDYDDFVVLATMDKVPDYIIFRFKYETENDFYNGTASSASKTHGNKPNNSNLSRNSYLNGWEYPFTDYYGNDIDIFNNVLTSEQIATGSTESGRFHIVSNGYEENYFGHFATRWYVYAPDGTYIGALPSSALLYYNESRMETAARNSVPEWFMTNATNNAGNKTANVSGQKSDFWKVYYDLYKGSETLGTPSAKGVPVEITYETAIRAEDYNSGGHPRNPALRNDGRWYYSRTARINANIIIEYKPTDDEKSNSVVTAKLTANGNNGYIVDDYAAELKGTALTSTDLASATNPVGKITGAAPKFTNVGKYNNMVVASNVPADPNNDFTFSVPSTTSSGVLTSDTTKAQTYLFEGWYIKKDGVYSKINPNDVKKLTGSTAMIGETTLVARYTPMSGDLLTITHDLYKDAQKYDNSPNAHSGTGTTYVSIQVLDNNGDVVSNVTTIKNSDSSVSIDKTVLKTLLTNDSNGKLKVTLTSIPDTNCTFTNLYRKTQSENDTIPNSSYTEAMQKIGYVDFANDTSSNMNNDAYNVNNWNSGSGTVGATNNEVVYTCSISDLLDDDNLKTNFVRFYTDIKLSGKPYDLTVVFKYYDRNDENNGQAETVDIKPTEVTVVQSITTGSEVTMSELTNAVANATVTAPEGSNTPVNEIKSAIDNYYFWTTQTDASNASSGFGKLTNHHNRESNYATETNDLKNGESYSLDYHADYYGYLPCESKYNQEKNGIAPKEKWVTYYDVNGRALLTQNVDSGSNCDVDPTFVKKVVVWCFNTPKQYAMTFNTAASESNLSAVSGETDIYAGTSTHVSKDFYYNERIGEADSGAYNYISDYLSKVFDTNGSGGHLNAPGTVTDNTTAQEIASSDTAKKYIFIGWYDAKGVRVSTDLTYQNRVTIDQTLTARYKKVASGETVTTPTGLNIIQNQTERFINDEGEDYYRYVMMLNPYGYEDCDTNIKKVAFLSIILPATDGENNGAAKVTKEQIDSAFAILTNSQNETTYELRTRIASAEAGSTFTTKSRIAVGSYNCTVRAYVYDTVVTQMNEQGQITNSAAIEAANKDTAVILTNKNRTQYSVIFPEDMVVSGNKRSDIVYFAAIGYSNDSTVESSEIVVSDGYVRYTNGAAN